MKPKKHLITLLILSCMLNISACGNSVKEPSQNGGNNNSPNVKTEATAEPTSVPTQEPTPAPTQEPTPAPTQEPTPAPTQEPTPAPLGDLPDNPDNPGNTISSLQNIDNLFELFENIALEYDEPELVKELNKSTGYICSDDDTLDELLELCELDVYWLSHEYIEDVTNPTFFRFEVTHENPVIKIPSDEGQTFLSEFTYYDVDYYLMFGAKDDSSDVEILTEEGITLEYWGLAAKQDDAYMVVPFFAGNEEHGYYLVRTSCEMMGVDVAETMTLAEQNISFATTSEPSEPDTPNPDQPLTALSSNEFSFEITEAVVENGLATLYCKLENGLDKEVFLDDEIIFLNGEDITDNTLFTFWVEENSSIEPESFSVFDYTLAAGDTLQISFTVVDYDTYEPIGTIDYSYTLSKDFMR